MEEYATSSLHSLACSWDMSVVEDRVPHWLVVMSSDASVLWASQHAEGRQSCSLMTPLLSVQACRFQCFLKGAGTSAADGNDSSCDLAGHGSQTADWTGEEDDGMNETICPCDFQQVRFHISSECPGPMQQDLLRLQQLWQTTCAGLHTAVIGGTPPIEIILPGCLGQDKCPSL